MPPLFCLPILVAALLAAAGPSLAANENRFIPRIPQRCLQIGICEEVPDYPEDHVTAIINEQGNALDKYRVNHLYTSEELLRVGSPDDMELCDSSIKHLTPQAGQDKDGKWHHIINQKDKPLQEVLVEVCKKPDSPCSNLANFYTGYEGKCKQKFIIRKMATLNEEGEMVPNDIKIPSCCSCVVHQTDE